MAKILSISMRHRDFGGRFDGPPAIRVPRPLRDLLVASPGGFQAASRAAWVAAQTAPGAWVGVPPTAFSTSNRRPDEMRLRARGEHLDLRIDFRGVVSASAIGRRVIIVAPSIPASAMSFATGGPVAQIVKVLFFDDPAITVERFIDRPGEAEIDIRCRCPSHVIKMDGP